MNRQFDYANVKNPEYFCDGRMEAYSDHAYYASETDMVDGESLFAESLNGIWKFHYARNYDAVVRGFEKEEYCCASWCRLISRWKGMTSHSMPIHSIHGKAGRISGRGRSRNILIRWQAM